MYIMDLFVVNIENEKTSETVVYIILIQTQQLL